MPNIATVFKSEIARLARKEVRAETDALRKMASQHRADIAALKREVKSLQSQLRRASRAGGRNAGPQESPAEEGRQLRFSAARLAVQRKRLGLSAADFGALVGVTGQSIYKWEQGGARPRPAQLRAIALVRAMGKREANAKLQELAKR